MVNTAPLQWAGAAQPHPQGSAGARAWAEVGAGSWGISIGPGQQLQPGSSPSSHDQVSHLPEPQLLPEWRKEAFACEEILVTWEAGGLLLRLRTAAFWEKTSTPKKPTQF